MKLIPVNLIQLIKLSISFIKRYTKLFDKNFPLQLEKLKKNHQVWMTKGLTKSCFKKPLYKRFCKNPTVHNRNRYRIYDNKFEIFVAQS